MLGMNNQRFTNPPTKSDWICAEESVVEQYVRTPACTFLFTLNGIEALLKSLAYIERQENIARIPKTLPVFIASGLEDPVGNYGVGVVHVRNRLKLAGVEKVSLHLYDGCRHELHNEAVKDVVYQEIYQWMKNIEEVHL